MMKYSFVLFIVLLLFALANLYQILLIDVGLHELRPPISLSDWRLTLGATSEASTKTEDSSHRVAGLSCEAYGGPSDLEAAEMVYWKDIPSDANYRSPLATPETSFLTFEPDEGGWNNQRMGLETAVMFAVLTGRTLVLPPEQEMYLLWNAKDSSKHKNSFTFNDFFHFKSVAEEHQGLRVLTFEQFLKETMGKLVSQKTGKVTFPPSNRTDWDGNSRNWESSKKGDGRLLWPWMRDEAALSLMWNNGQCIAALPAQVGKVENLQRARLSVFESDAKKFEKHAADLRWRPRMNSYIGNPTPVDAPVEDRMAEFLNSRKDLCLYDQYLYDQKVLHFKGEERTGHRLLIHFYAFLFHEDYHQDLWMKRFVRDHLRYRDEIQCAAARIVSRVRKIAKENGEALGSFDAMHIRRGDFQYLEMRIKAEEIYANNTKSFIRDGRTMYIATDEKDMAFFAPLKQHYKVVFLNDFIDELSHVNPNYYGMVEQLVTSRAQTFIGAYFSTFTGYINRIRGYHAQNAKIEGYQQGQIESFYYTPDHMQHLRRVMRKYTPVTPGPWQQEFAVGWRDIDHDVPEAQKA